MLQVSLPKTDMANHYFEWARIHKLSALNIYFRCSATIRWQRSRSWTRQCESSPSGKTWTTKFANSGRNSSTSHRCPRHRHWTQTPQQVQAQRLFPCLQLIANQRVNRVKRQSSSSFMLLECVFCALGSHSLFTAFDFLSIPASARLIYFLKFFLS